MDPKQLLADLRAELSSQVLEEVVEVEGHTYRLQLLSDFEDTWTWKHIRITGALAVAKSLQTPTLAASIKEIDETPVALLFHADLEDLSDEDKTALFLDQHGLEEFYLDKMYEFVSSWNRDLKNELWGRFKELEERRKTAKEQVKNSSGESSEKDTNQSGTELSQDGEN